MKNKPSKRFVVLSILTFLCFGLLVSIFYFTQPKIIAAADPNFIKTVDKVVSGWGEELHYTLSYTNTTGQMIPVILAEDIIPANTTYVVGSSDAIFSGGRLRWQINNLANGATWTTQFTLTSVEPVSSDVTAVINAPTKVNTGYSVSLDATQSTGWNRNGEIDNYGIENYEWSFGDGTPPVTTAYGAMVSHTYTTADPYMIFLKVTDSRGGINYASKLIEVSTLPVQTVTAFTDEAVQAAVTSLNTNGIVHLPAGTYLFDRQVQLRDGIVIEGEGRDKTIITQPGGSGKAFTLGGNNTRITGLKVMNISDDTVWPVAIEMSVANRHGYKNLYVDSCEFEHMQQVIKGTYLASGANLTGASAFFENNVIHNNDYPGMGYGFSSEMGSYTVAKNNTFYTNRHSVEGGGRSGGSSNNYVYISYKSGYDLIGNTFEGPNSPRGNNSIDVASDMHMSGRGRIRIVDNTYKNIKYGIGLHDGWGEIKNNTFQNVGYVNTSGSSYIITLTKDSHNGYDGNNCIDYLDPNLTGREVCKGAFNFDIKDNIFIDNPAPNWYWMQYDATHPIQNIKINGCQVSSNTYAGKGNIGDAGLICP